MLTIKDRIAFHIEVAKDSAKLAAMHAKEEEYREAADFYNSAAFHQAVAEALKR